jgi:hypothetical protein
VRPTGGIDAAPDAGKWITDAILAGKISVPIAASFPIEQIRDAVALQAGRIRSRISRRSCPLTVLDRVHRRGSAEP